jgi:D-alanyl-D-alanine carboxypeptidase
MLSRRTSTSALLAVALVLASCGSDDDSGTTESTTVATEATPEEAVATTDAPTESADTTSDAGSSTVVDQSAIDAAAAAFLEGQAAQGVTAFYVAISDPVNGEFESAYGDASVDGPAATVDDNFRIGSISKTVTATVILQLVDSGDLALDDTVGDLLPDLVAEHPEITEVTVEQLLNMTSGIPDYLNMNDAILPLDVEDPSRVWAPEELIAAGVGAGVDETRAPSYSTTNFIILQLICRVGDRLVAPGLDHRAGDRPAGSRLVVPATKRGHHTARASHPWVHRRGLPR